MASPQDIYDGEPWSEIDIEDLKGAVAYGRSLEETAQFLCRSGTPFEVAAYPALAGTQKRSRSTPRSILRCKIRTSR
jgi:hypothetical protein